MLNEDAQSVFILYPKSSAVGEEYDLEAEIIKWFSGDLSPAEWFPCFAKVGLILSLSTLKAGVALQLLITPSERQILPQSGSALADDGLPSTSVCSLSIITEKTSETA